MTFSLEDLENKSQLVGSKDSSLPGMVTSEKLFIVVPVK